MSNEDDPKLAAESLRAEEIALKREELEIRRQDSAKSKWASPLVLAFVGLVATVLAGMMQNYFQSEAARKLERQRFEAALIQKAVETADADEAARRLQMLVNLEFIKDEKGEIAKLVANPENIPLQPSTPQRSDESFIGITRSEAKLSIGTEPVKKFSDIKNLIASLPEEDEMKSRKEVAGREAPRVAEEQQNVQFPAFLYFAKRQLSNDYWLVLGLGPNTQPELYIIAVVRNAPAYEKLKSVRQDLVQGVNQQIASRYTHFDPPIKVEVEGSLFFDASHGWIWSDRQNSTARFLPGGKSVRPRSFRCGQSFFL